MFEFLNPTPEEQLARDIKGLQDSVDVINELITIELDAQQASFLRANIDHINIMLDKEHLKEDTSDKSVFTAAVAAGEAKLA
jgi:hypothetical protein